MKKYNFIFRYLKTLSVIAGVSLVVYFVIRVYFFFFNSYGIWDRVFAGLLILAESYMIIHALGYIAAIYRLGGRQKRYSTKHLNPFNLPSVAVVIAARHEPLEILEQTIITANNLRYAKKKVYLLDGSSEQKFLDDNQALCEKYDIGYFHPENLHGAKAGTLNDFIFNSLTEDYLAVLDADANPLPDFLDKVVTIAESDSKIAFVQTPQFYSNVDVSPIARGAAMQQSVFYEAICESKNTINAMFCCGTNVLLRRKALLAVGGFDEESITEDFATSLKFHLHGYRSVYFNHVRVFSMAPETLPGYFKQQARWAAGTTGVLRKIVANFFRHPFALSVGQWWEYFLSGSYYFLGWAFVLLMICPIAFLVFQVPSYFMSPYVYIPAFLPYFIMTLTIFYGIMKKRNYSLKEVYYGNILGSLSFPILMVASIQGIVGAKMEFAVTPKGQDGRLNIWQLWPWIAMILLSALGIIFGIIRFRENPFAFGINIFWCIYHIFILSQIFRLNKVPKIKNQQIELH
jgi:cellulose synthase (UDP-forming)